MWTSEYTVPVKGVLCSVLELCPKLQYFEMMDIYHVIGVALLGSDQSNSIGLALKHCSAVFSPLMGKIAYCSQVICALSLFQL